MVRGRIEIGGKVGEEEKAGVGRGGMYRAGGRNDRVFVRKRVRGVCACAQGGVRRELV